MLWSPIVRSVSSICEHRDVVVLSSSDTESFHDLIFSPVKPKIEESPIDVLKQVISNVKEDDYHDTASKCVPVLARPVQGLNVTQLFTLMLGKIPADCICKRKPTSVTYSSVFVIDLTCVKCIDDLRADDNMVSWWETS